MRATRRRGDYEYNPEKAIALLKEAGYESGQLRLRFVYPTTDQGTKFAASLQAMMSAVGIELVMEGIDFNASLQRIVERNIDLAMLTYGSTPYNPPNTYNAVIRSDANWNASQLTGPEVDEMDKLIDEAFVEQDYDVRNKMFRDAMIIFRKLAITAPCYQCVNFIMADSRLGGVNYENVCAFSKYYRYQWQ